MENEKIIWKNEIRKVSELIPSDYNPRKLSEEQKNNIKKSLERFNLADPIIINLDNKIIGGHQRITVLFELGVEDIDVRVPSRQLTEEEEKELNIRLNKNSGEWDLIKLIDFDKNFLSNIGFNNNELSKIFDEKDDDSTNKRTIVFTVSHEEEMLIRDSLEKEINNPSLIRTGKKPRQSEILCSILKRTDFKTD
jgi:hypothetical protein